MLDWNSYRAQLQTGREGDRSAQARYGAKMRGPMSLAVAITLRCDGCITFYTEAAIKQGRANEKMTGALGTAKAVNAGAALVYSTRVMDAFEQYPCVTASQA